MLADSGCGTRSEVKKIIKSKRVKINDITVIDGAVIIEPDKDIVTLDGKTVHYEKYRYYMFNKPAGCVSATRDKLSITVLEYLKDEVTKDLFPVGRLDKDTEGFLLITNDGNLAHNLLSPKKHVDKVYYAEVSRELSDGDMLNFRNGVDIGDEKKTLPAMIETAENRHLADKDSRGAYLVTLREGRFHQVKRMFEAFSSEVLFLKRESMGKVMLDKELEPGKYRLLTREEVDMLKNIQGDG